MITKVEADKILGWPKRLYHKKCLAGKVFQTVSEQDEQKKEGWVESPAFLNKVKEEVKEEKKVKAFDLGDKSDTKSKIDLSVKGKKKDK